MQPVSSLPLKLAGNARTIFPGERSLRVLLVTPRYPPHIGGVENHVFQVAQRMARVGVDVSVLTTRFDATLPVKETKHGVTVHRVRAFPAHRDYFFAPGIFRAITRGDWDVIHLQSYHTLVAPITLLAARAAGIPYVVTFHSGGNSSSARNAMRRMQRRLLAPLLSGANRLIALTDFEKELFVRAGIPPAKFVVIPNGTDLPLPQTPVPIEKGFIVSVGRLEKYKGHQRILSALPHIIAQESDAHLWLAGEGAYRPELETLANTLGVSARVEIGAVPATARAAMAEKISRAALVVLLSEYETQPLAVLEALALRRPVLVADAPGLREIAAQHHVPQIALDASPAHLANVVVDLLRHPPAPAPVHLPTWDDCAAQLVDLYREVARRHACAS